MDGITRGGLSGLSEQIPPVRRTTFDVLIFLGNSGLMHLVEYPLRGTSSRLEAVKHVDIWARSWIV